MPLRLRPRIPLLVSMLLVAALGWGGATDALTDAGRRPVTVMSQNMFQGTELGEVIAAQTPATFLAAVTTDYQQVVNSNPAARIDAMAAGIAAREPDLVGLQEAALWRKRTPGSPAATNVAYDF